ncbi:MAG: cysteine synthase family protein [Actinomycetota bacterium]|nr:cysteine synthase family protein [Actinomycetota bacterium]
MALVGHTPLVRLSRLSPRPEVAIYAKLEWYNPTGSVKDRVAAGMVLQAEAEGILAAGAHLVEPSSGNTGIALARVARLRGYILTVLLPANVSEERKQLLAGFGATVVETPAEEGSNGAIARAESLAEERGYVLLHQYQNAANPAAHYHGTGQELLEALDGADAFVAGLGTGGTLMGVGGALRDANPSTQVVAVEPPAGEQVLGLRSLDEGYIPPVFDPAFVDGKILVRSEAAVLMTRRLLHEEGLFAGLSSGAAVHGALRWAERLEEGVVVTLLPDGGWKYLSTGAWTDPVDEVVERISGQLFF